MLCKWLKNIKKDRRVAPAAQFREETSKKASV